MSTGRAIAVNSLWMIGGKIATTLLSLALATQLIRALGVVGFGEYTTAFAFMNFFGVIADFGFYQILVREVAAHPDDEWAISQNVFSLRTVFAVIVYSAAALLALVFPYSAAVKTGIAVLALASLFQSINTTLIGTLQVHQQMYKAVIGDVVGRVSLVILVLVALHRHVSLPILLTMYLVTNAINLAITAGFLQRLVPLGWATDLARWRMLLREATPLAVVTILGIVYFKIDTVLLSLFKSAADVGIYGAAYKIFELLTVIPGIFMGNVFPALTRRLVTDALAAHRLIQQAFNALMLFGLAISAGMITLAEPIMHVLAGASFLSASTVSFAGHPITAVQIVMILAVALIGVFIGNLWGFVVIALGKQRNLIMPGVIAVVINVGLNLLLIPRASYLAAAVTTVITEFAVALIWGAVAQRLLPQRLSLEVAAKGLLAALIMSACVWPLRHLLILLPIGIGALAYIALLGLFSAIPPQWRSYFSRSQGATA